MSSSRYYYHYKWPGQPLQRNTHHVTMLRDNSVTDYSRFNSLPRRCCRCYIKICSLCVNHAVASRSPQQTTLQNPGSITENLLIRLSHRRSSVWESQCVYWAEQCCPVVIAVATGAGVRVPADCSALSNIDMLPRCACASSA